MRGPFQLFSYEGFDVADERTVSIAEANFAIEQDKEVYIEMGKMLKQAIYELVDTRAKLGVAEEALFNIENMRPHRDWIESAKDITSNALGIIRK